MYIVPFTVAVDVHSIANGFDSTKFKTHMIREYR